MRGLIRYVSERGGHNNYEAAGQALTRLLADLAAAEQRADEDRQRGHRLDELIFDLEQRLASAERERDEALTRAKSAEEWARVMEHERDYEQEVVSKDAFERLDAVTRREEQLREALARAVYLADHLHAMVPREVWLAQGGDDGQGHYEGDYFAEQTLVELRGLAVLADVGGDEAGDLVSTSTKFKEAIAALKAAEQEAVATQNTASTEGHGA